MKRKPYNIEITSKKQLLQVADALLQWNGQLLDCYRYPNTRYRYMIRIMLWEGTEDGFTEYAGVQITPPPIVILEQNIDYGKEDKY